MLSGRIIRWNNTLNPFFHVIQQLIGESLLMQLIINKSHDLIGCNTGIASYVNHVRMSGFLACNLELPVKKRKLDCKRCPFAKLTMTGKSDAQWIANQYLRGPEDFLPTVLSTNPLSCLQLDKTGPMYLGTQTEYTKVWVLIAVKIITRRIHLIPLQHQSTLSFVHALEILESRRGRLTTIMLTEIQPIHHSKLRMRILIFSDVHQKL